MRQAWNGISTLVVGALLVMMAGGVSAQRPRVSAAEQQLERARQKEIIEGDIAGAIRDYQTIVRTAGASERPIVAEALLALAGAFDKLRDPRARDTYARVLREFGDLPEPASRARAATAQQTATQLYKGSAVSPDDVSPDGRHVSMTDWATGDLAVFDLTTGTPQRLTNTGGWDVSGSYAYGTVFSTDGRQIAYGWLRDEQRRPISCELRVLPFTPGQQAEPRVLHSSASCEVYWRPLAWVPGGRQLVVLRQDTDRVYQIGLVALQDATYRSLVTLEWRSPERTTVSPDGRYVAYAVPAVVGGDRDITVLALDGGGGGVVVGGATDDHSPIWAPSSAGSRLVFVSNRTPGTNSLWALDFNAGRVVSGPTLVKAAVGAMSPLGFSATGTFFYTEPGTGGGRNVHVAPFDGRRVTSAPIVATTQYVSASQGPEWSPDGRSLAYYTLGDAPRLIVRTTADGRERQIALPRDVHGLFFAGPRWFPDGRSLLIQRALEAGTAFDRLDPETGRTTTLHTSRVAVSSFDLSPDGGSIFYTARQQSIIRFDIDARRETVLKEARQIHTLAVSPDGGSIAYTTTLEGQSNSGALEVIPAAGGTARELARGMDGGSRFNALAWTPDSRAVLFTKPDGRLYRVAADGSQAAEPIDGVALGAGTRIKSPSVSPDGQWLAFGTAVYSNEIWRLERLLPAAGAR